MLQVLPSEKYGEGATIYFGTFSGGDFSGTVSWGGSHTIEISKDGGAFAAVSATPTELDPGFHSLVLSATELEAGKVLIRIIDGGAVYDDVAIQLATYGDASAHVSGDVSRIDKVLQVILSLVVRR